MRSSKQDQIHSSIVSTLLALMDGLDSRGQIVVIGATNRIDAIDPALRRPVSFHGYVISSYPAIIRGVLIANFTFRFLLKMHERRSWKFVRKTGALLYLKMFLKILVRKHGDIVELMSR